MPDFGIFENCMAISPYWCHGTLNMFPHPVPHPPIGFSMLWEEFWYQIIQFLIDIFKLFSNPARGVDIFLEYEMKKEKTAWVFLLIHEFWSVLLEHFIERKPLILIWRVTHFFGPWKSVTNWMVTYIYKIISMKWVSDGQRPKTCRGCGWIFFFHSCHKLWCGPGQERPFFQLWKKGV